MKLYSFKSKLTTYYRIYTGEKPLACQVCNIKFSHKGSLVKHQAIHSNVRSFKYSICLEGKYFKTKDCYGKQIIFDYKSKFACSHCYYKCHRKYSLNVHQKTHEKKKNEY